MTSLERVEAVVKAVLYEGYMLYPYRPSSVKNRQRWTFGGIYPRDCAAHDESLRSTMQTECLLRRSAGLSESVERAPSSGIARPKGRASCGRPMRGEGWPLDQVRGEVPGDLPHGSQHATAISAGTIEANPPAPHPGPLPAGGGRGPAGESDTLIDVRVRFLHLLKREVGRLDPALAEMPADGEPSFTLVPFLGVGDKRLHAWEEAVERTVMAEALTLNELLGARVLVPFRFAGQRELEPVRAPDGTFPGILIRSAAPVEGALTISAKEVAPSVFKLTVVIENVTPVERAAALAPDDAQQRAFASTHTILAATGGEFISSIDPPDALADISRQCENQGTWPVMAGEEGAKDIVLSSPIILYDYPQIAPESPGDLFDSTEIDEILTLRILAMTDDEKRDMAAVDERARALLERTEALTSADMARLHGTLREPHLGSSSGASWSAASNDPWRAIDAKPQLAFLRVDGTDLKVGDRVRLKPKPGADIMDIVLKDEVAMIEAIERDFEDRIHVAVVLESDPGREFGLDRMPGHRFFFGPDELEAVGAEHEA